MHIESARAYRESGDYNLALQELKKAQELGFNNEEIHFCLGQIYRDQEKYDQAKEEFEIARKIAALRNDIFLNNRVLKEIEICQRKTILESKPMELWVTLTTKCNIRCIICNVWGKHWDLPENVAKDIIKYLPYLQDLHWQGGEVFLYPCFEELFERASSYPNLNQNINTNGLLINEGWARKFAKSNISIAYAIDGVSKETYEYIRRGAKFDELIRSLTTLNGYKIKESKDSSPAGRMTTIMSFMVMKSNYNEMEKTLDFAKRYEFDVLQIYPIETTVDPENIFIHDDKKALEYIEKALSRIVKRAKEYGVRLNILNFKLPLVRDGDSDAENRISQKEENNSDEVLRKCPELKNKGILCDAPWRHLFIQAGGLIQPSCRCFKEIGNISENTLEELWNGEKMQLYRKKILENDCSSLCYRMHKKTDVCFESSKIYFTRKEYDLAVDRLKKYLSSYPDNKEANFLLARTYTQQKANVLAIEEFKKLLMRYPDDRTVHYELGLNYLEVKDYDSALKEFEQVVRLGFDNDEIRSAIGKAYAGFNLNSK